MLVADGWPEQTRNKEWYPRASQAMGRKERGHPRHYTRAIQGSSVSRCPTKFVEPDEVATLVSISLQNKKRGITMQAIHVCAKQCFEENRRLRTKMSSHL
jgi:hypothetical protein